MEFFLNSCVCQSESKQFRIVTLKNMTNFNFSCGIDNEIAINSETQDYKALGLCQPPVMNQYYSIGLRIPDITSANRRECNKTYPYFWRTRGSEDIKCVNGSPLILPRKFDGDRRCNLASVLPGSLDQISNAKWTRCSSVRYSICQLERNASMLNSCKNVSTTTTTALSNNNTAIIIGSVSGVFVVLFLLWLLHFFRKRNNAKRNASENEVHEEVVYNK